MLTCVLNFHKELCDFTMIFDEQFTGNGNLNLTKYRSGGEGASVFVRYPLFTVSYFFLFHFES